MITYVLYAAFGILTLAVALGLLRLARGPTVIDRIMAFDLITTGAVGMIVLLSIQWRTALYLELILIFSLLGFFGTVAFVYYLSRTQDLDPPIEEQSATDRVPPSDEHR
jgi:multisubunit Na+/H+ antiporter MnhF subunit